MCGFTPDLRKRAHQPGDGVSSWHLSGARESNVEIIHVLFLHPVLKHSFHSYVLFAALPKAGAGLYSLLL